MIRVPLRGRESQCPICDRVFSSDSTCEKHKTYSGDRAKCVDPSGLGMVMRPASSDREFEVWTMPIPEELKWWTGNVPVPRAETQSLTCMSCGVVWERPSQRGRKPHKCDKCRAIELEAE